MNYNKIYNSIISLARERVAPDCYCEKHHIIPKSMGGSDSKENIVILTAREHFIAHWLLLKIHKNKSMTYAFFAMTKPVGNGKKRYTSKSFKYARESMATWMSKNRSGKNHPMYGITGSDNPNYGAKRNDSTKELLSISAKKRTGKLNPRSKKVLCVETGNIFDTVAKAREFAGKGNVSYALKSGGTAGGYHFKYIDNKGMETNIKSTLKGYPSGSRSHNSIKIKNSVTGRIFDTAKEASKSISATPQAIMWSIRNSKACKGSWFERV